MLGRLLFLIVRRLVPVELLDLDAQRADVLAAIDDLADGHPCDGLPCDCRRRRVPMAPASFPVP